MDGGGELPDICIHGNIVGSCSACDNIGDDECRHGYPLTGDCPFCREGIDYDDVIVIACPGCGKLYGCDCEICPSCWKKMYQCNCVYCAKCRKPISLCTCYTYPDPNPGTGGGSGSGTTPGEEEGNTENVILEDVELMNEDNFVPYSQFKNCMKVCVAIMEKYGVDPESSAHVYQLLYEKNGVLSYYDRNNYAAIYKCAIACINRHLDSNRPIIVGVNHSLNKGINEGVTDHWIVITGRGYDLGQKQYYYTYMDSGRNNMDAACDTRKNRLYYDSENHVFKDDGASTNDSKQYDVTQVRPNDGKNLDETIVQP